MTQFIVAADSQKTAVVLQDMKGLANNNNID